MRLACLVGVLLQSAMGGNPADHRAFRGPSPSCLLNHLPCPVVDWDPDWSLINSTAMMARTVLPSEHRWGLVTLDNRVGIAEWAARGPSHASLERTSAENCRRLKRAGLAARCGIYHNVELGLEWLESNRAAMDPAHVAAGWFLRYKNGSVFDHPTSMVVDPGTNATMSFRQYFIDWRTPDAAAYFVEAIVNATLADGVDATFTDDNVGIPDEHPELQSALGLTDAELGRVQFATQSAGQYLATSLAAAGRTCWDCIGGTQGERNQQPPGCIDSGGHGKGPCPGCTGGTLNCSAAKGQNCIEDMRRYCAPAMQGRGLFMAWDPEGLADHNQTLAAFLVVRPPLAFIGGRLSDADWSPLFGLDVGTPLQLCKEGPSGIFSRDFSKGVAELNCNTWTGKLPFEPLEL